MENEEIVFLDAMSDMGFKKIFKTPEILIPFLNEILKNTGRKIVSVTYNDKESYSRETDKYVIFDVFCKSDDGSEFIIEMQKGRQDYFGNRSLYYMAQALVVQGINKSDWDYDLKPVYGVFFLNFHLEKYTKPEDVITEYAIRDDYGNSFSDDFKMFFIDLLKFGKTEEECLDFRDQMIYIVKNLKKLKKMPFLSIDKVFEKLADVASYSKLSQEERFTYEQQLKHERDWNACLNSATRQGLRRGYSKGMEKGLKEGMEKGLEKGLEKGRAEERFSIARNMKSSGLDIQSIMNFTGLTKEEIDSL